MMDKWAVIDSLRDQGWVVEIPDDEQEDDLIFVVTVAHDDGSYEPILALWDDNRVSGWSANSAFSFPGLFTIDGLTDEEIVSTMNTRAEEQILGIKTRVRNPSYKGIRDREYKLRGLMFTIRDVADIEEALDYIINLKDGAQVFVHERGGHIKALDPNGVPNNKLSERFAKWLWDPEDGEDEVIFGDLLRPATNEEVESYRQWRNDT